MILKVDQMAAGRDGGAPGRELQEWRELAELSSAPPFMYPGWFEILTRSFGLPDLSVLAVRGSGGLTGVLPVAVKRGVTRSVTNWHTPLYGALIRSDGAAEELATQLMQHVRRRLDLSMIDCRDPLVPALRSAALDARMRTLERVVASQPYVDLSLGFDAFQLTLGRRHLKELRRQRRRLGELGEVTFTVHDGSERLMPLLDEGFALEASGWKGEQGSAIVSAPETRNFYTEIAEWAAGQGWLRLMFLRVDGRAVSFDMCLEAAGREYVLKGGFDPAFRRFGPGALLTWEALQRAFALGLSTYEFLGAADPYKLAWAPHTADRLRFQAFGRTVPGRLETVAWRRGRPLAKRAIARAGALRRS